MPFPSHHTDEEIERELAHYPGTHSKLGTMAKQLLAERDEARIALAEAQVAIYVPGQWRCPKCGFELTKSILHAKSGNIGPDLSRAEPCPNDGEPMQRVTWKDDAMRMAERLPELFADRRRLEFVLSASGSWHSRADIDQHKAAITN